MTWRSRALHLAIGPNTAEKHLADAYADVFGKQTASVEMVLVDLANHTGFYRIDPPDGDLSLYQAGHRAGMRAAFGRLFQFLSLSDEQLRALEEAARFEASTNP